MTKLADELEALAKNATPGPWGFDGTFSDSNYIGAPTADIFMHNSWPLEHEAEAAANVQIVLALHNNLGTIIAALRQPIADEVLAQRLQDHMEQHHGVCLQASQWDEAIAALRGPDAAPEDPLGDGSDYGVTPLVDDKWPDAVPGDLVERVAKVKKWLDGGCSSWGTPAQDIRKIAAAIQSLTAERDEALARVAELEAALQNPPPHRFWGVGEPDCPRELKCGNGELHTMMCKVCRVKNPLDNICRALLEGGSKP